MRRLAVILSLALAAGSGAAEESLQLETSTVTGNRELPKVMVIVPWKKAAPGDVPGRPVDSLLDEAMQPVGRSAFRRELAGYRDLEEEAASEQSEKEE